MIIVENEEKAKINSFYIDEPEKHEQICIHFDKVNRVKKILHQYINHQGTQEINATVPQCLKKAVDQIQKEEKALFVHATLRTAGYFKNNFNQKKKFCCFLLFKN
jgi:hypothetical protein